ncbi:hypothetical protein TNCV_4696421 [Trichonephila clavipes]|nr:hypothetical protein TNCV_4696421 [Trichonephila clavipes]
MVVPTQPPHRGICYGHLETQLLPPPNPSTLFTFPQMKSNPLFPGSSREILGTSLPEPTTGASSELFPLDEDIFLARERFLKVDAC